MCHVADSTAIRTGGRAHDSVTRRRATSGGQTLVSVTACLFVTCHRATHSPPPTHSLAPLIGPISDIKTKKSRSFSAHIMKLQARIYMGEVEQLHTLFVRLSLLLDGGFSLFPPSFLRSHCFSPGTLGQGSCPCSLARRAVATACWWLRPAEFCVGAAALLGRAA